MNRQLSRTALLLFVPSALGSCGGTTTMHLGDASGGAGAGGTMNTLGNEMGGSTNIDPGTGTAGASIDPGAGGSAADGMNAGVGQPVCAPSAAMPDAGTSVRLAMTNVQYDNTIRDLLGITTSASTMAGFPPEQNAFGFAMQPAPVSSIQAQLYAQSANALAMSAISRLAQLVQCDPASAGEMACATQFIQSFGRHSFRRPLSPNEINEMTQYYAQARSTGDFASGIASVIAHTLSSPKFYELEQPGAAGLNLLNPYQLASRLSYFLWQTMPDDELLDAAQGGKLAAAADVAREARRMLDDPKAHDGVGRFFSEWLSLDAFAYVQKATAIFPTYAFVAQDMVTETKQFTESIFFSNGPFESLLTSSKTFVNDRLAELYEVPGVVGSSFQNVALNPKIRAGILTQASFLSLQASQENGSPVRRGAFVREKLLCQAIPPEPAGLVPQLGDPMDPSTTTNRERFAAHASQPACAACHRLMDPIGFGLEEFDAIGHYRTTDNGKAVDASGQVTGVSNEFGFVGGVELSTKLASLPEVRSCAVTQWFRYALARAESAEDACSINAAAQVLASKGGLEDMVVALVTSDSFRYARW